MNQYYGLILIKAKPMTRGEYALLREWKLLQDEEPSDEGYIVEHLDSRKPNTKGYVGYTSWMRKSVFEKTYWELTEIGITDASTKY